MSQSSRIVYSKCRPALELPTFDWEFKMMSRIWNQLREYIRTHELEKKPYKSACVITENTISMLAASCQKHLPKLQVHYQHLFYLFLVALFISAGSAGAAFAATALQWRWKTTTTTSAAASSSTNSSSSSSGTSSKQQQQQQQQG